VADELDDTDPVFVYVADELNDDVPVFV